MAAEPVVIGEQLKGYPLGTHSDILEDKTRVRTLEDVSSDKISALFSPSQEEFPAFGFTSSVYWIRFTVINPLDKEVPWFLEIAYPLLDDIDLYIPQPDGQYRLKRTGDHLPFDTREVNYRNFVFRLQESPGGPHTYYIRFETEGVMNLPLKMWSSIPLAEKMAQEQTLLGIYYGAILIMLVYNLFIFASVRDKSYLYYVLFNTSWLLALFILNGLAFQYLWPHKPSWANISLPFFFCLAYVWGVQFSRSFLNTPYHTPGFDKILRVLLIMAGVGVLSSPFIKYSSSVWLANLLATSSVFVWITGFICLMRGYRQAYYYVMAWSPLLFGVSVFAMGNFGILPHNFLTSWGLQIGSALEVVLLSLGLADRMNTLRKELTAQQRFLEEVLNQIPAGIIIAEAPSGKFVLSNNQMKHILSHPFLPFSNIREYCENKGFHADGRPYTPEEWPIARSIQRGEEVMGEEIDFLRSDNTLGTLRISSAPIRNRDGQIIAGVMTFYDITERKRLENELREQAKALIEADRRKDEFLTMLAHELRNPLASISNTLELIHQHSEDPGYLSRALDILVRQTRSLTRLVDDLLDIARITRGKITLRKELLELSTVISRAVETARFSIESRKHHLLISLPEEPLWLIADPVRMEQILVNLLNNAAKYTDPGGRIWLTAVQEGKEIVLRVRDTGIGIPAELLPRIFDLYVQVDRSLDRSEGGLGIGLTLVQYLVQLHGGSVAAYSEGVGRGSEFVVRLPAHPGFASKTEGSVLESPTPLTQGKRRKILVVDDDVTALETLSELLKQWGHEVKVAQDGSSALETVSHYQPEMVILDIGLPDMEGYEIARQIRQGERGQEILLVALTGYGEEARRRSQEAGFDYHFTKPVDLAALKEVVNVKKIPPRDTGLTPEFQ
jgi:signal transduction histidine kinase/CheY-like chemotaxis protein